MYGIINWMTMLNHEDPMLQEYERACWRSSERSRRLRCGFSITYIHSVKAPLLVLQGDNDPRVPKEEAEQVVTLSEEGWEDGGCALLPERRPRLRKT